MIERIAALALFALVLVHAPPAAAQYTNKTGNVVGTIGGACNSTNNDYGWPDTNGNILKCVSNVWTLQGITAAAAGSTGYVQFNNGGALAGSGNLFWDNTNNRLGIGTTSPSQRLDLGGGNISMGYEIDTNTVPANSSIGWYYATCSSGKQVLGGACTSSSGGYPTNTTISGTTQYGCYVASGYTSSSYLVQAVCANIK